MPVVKTVHVRSMCQYRQLPMIPLGYRGMYLKEKVIETEAMFTLLTLTPTQNPTITLRRTLTIPLIQTLILNTKPPNFIVENFFCDDKRGGDISRILFEATQRGSLTIF